MSKKPPTNVKMAARAALCTSLLAASPAMAGEALQEKAKTLLARPNLLARLHELPFADSQVGLVYRATDTEADFNLHSYLAFYDGRFWASWSSGLGGEEMPGQVVRYATSEDGIHWSQAKVLAEPPMRSDGKGPRILINRGLFVHEGQLINYVAQLDEVVRGEAWTSLELRRHVWDDKAKAWRDGGLVIDDAINNYPPRPLGDAMFMTRRDGPRKMYTLRSAGLDDQSHWTSTPLPEGEGRPSEPGWYLGPDGAAHLLMRYSDGGGAKRLLHSVSTDGGLTWSPPVVTDYPDATSKNFAGILSDGRIYVINNPGPGRKTLTITFSDDGWTFDHAMALVSSPPKTRYPDAAWGKPSPGFQYPHAIEHDGALWLISSVNKEDIQVNRFALEQLQPE